MPTALTPVAERSPRLIDLATMSLADAPDLWTAIEAGIMHGLAPREAMRSAFHKWLGENADTVQTFGLVNFYEPGDHSRAFVNHKAFMEFAVITMAEQQRTIDALVSEVRRVRAVLPYTPPSED